ncbi:hypothetical protein PLESTB_001291500 [Pleodorina starrii]|uniref:Uncharacterized protein n=1 Tax=Pleodorina starrii TaxID=330485 RepID=A0A9W6BUW6_9CHLO|nr:hypothetical protein PLESTM_000957400 [Pleodorina starrii]GLC57936.1 hypothetical protein PLESTB_001291500 [Pleodorina starrii]
MLHPHHHHHQSTTIVVSSDLAPHSPQQPSTQRNETRPNAAQRRNTNSSSRRSERQAERQTGQTDRPVPEPRRGSDCPGGEATLAAIAPTTNELKPSTNGFSTFLCQARIQ